MEGQAPDELIEALAATLAPDPRAGAAVAVAVDGELRAHAWGGEARPDRPWEAGTACPIFSATKALATVVALALHDDGVLDLAEPVVPGPAGAGGPTVAQVLGHRSGHPALTAPATVDEALDPEAMAARLLGQAPEWPHGTDHGYHALTFGWLVDAAVRSRTGRSLGTELAERVARGRPVRIGTPPPAQASLAAVVRAAPAPSTGTALALAPEPDPADARLAEALTTDGSLPQRAMLWPPLLARPAAIDRPEVLEAEWASVNGTATAEALAVVASEVASGRLLSPDSLALLARPASDGPDRVLLGTSRFGHGVMLPGRLLPVPSPTAFGHTGASGAVVLCDPAHGLGFAYLTRTAHAGLGADPRAASLVAALYRGLG